MFEIKNKTNSTRRRPKIIFIVPFSFYKLNITIILVRQLPIIPDNIIDLLKNILIKLILERIEKGELINTNICIYIIRG